MTTSELCANCGAELSDAAAECSQCSLTLTDAWAQWRRRRRVDFRSAEADELFAELKELLEPSFELIAPVGAGGMGLVYLAHDAVLKRLVAIKVLSPDFAAEETARARFTREVEAIAAITHPHVVSIYQVGELPKSRTPFFLMQYVEGTTLRSEVRPGEIVPEARVRRILGEVAMALAAAHSRGLVHRDIKPANIMLERESGRALVVDFGISATVATSRAKKGHRLTMPDLFVGTPAYMSPEQALGLEVTPASDIYSLGVVAYELLTGQLPVMGGSSADIMAGHGSTQALTPIRELRPELHPQLAELIDRSLRKDPTRRPSADEIARLIFASTRRFIEWPPPGLGQLRALGARLSQTLAVAEGTGLLFFLLLMMQPAIASVRWYEQESSAFWNLVLLPNAFLRAKLEGSTVEAQQATVEAAPVWGFLLTLCVVVMLICIPFVIGRAFHLAYRVRWARRSGYPWKVIFAVGWDYRRETAALLNGTGIYALLSRRERRRLVRLRWIEQISGAIGILLGVLMPLLWLIVASRRPSSRSGLLLSPTEALVVIAPPLLALLVLMICKRPESRHRARMLRQRVFMTRSETPLVRPELVSNWLKSVRLPAATPPRMPATVAASLPIIMALVATAIVLALFLSTLPSLIATSRGREPALSWLASFASDSTRPLRWQLLDRALPEETRAPASGDPGRLWTLVRATTAASASADSADRLAPADARLSRILARQRIMLNEGEIGRHTRDTSRAEFRAWRLAAQSRPVPRNWYVWRSELPGATPAELLQQAGLLREVAAINATAGLFAAQRGDTAEFRQRIAENTTLATALLRSPLPGVQLVSLDILLEGRRLGRMAGSRSSDLSGDDDTTSPDVLLRAARSETEFFARGRHGLLMADPRSPPGQRYLADTTLSPAARWSIASAAITGFCHNGREILFGLDRRREELLGRSAELLSDIPGSDVWMSMHRDWLAAGLPVATRPDGRIHRMRPRALHNFPSRLRFCGNYLPGVFARGS